MTGRPNQCLRCHSLGHLVKDCPKSSQRQTPQVRAIATDPAETMTTAVAETGSG